MSNTHTVAIPKHELVGLYRQALSSGVPLDKIEEKVHKLLTRTEVSEHVEAKDDTVRTTKLKKQLPALVRFGAMVVPLFFVGVGIFLVGSAVIPILGYYITSLPGLQASNLTTPIPRDQVLDITPLVIAQNNQAQAQVASAQSSEPVIIDTQLDYTNLANWFGETLPSNLESQAEAKTFILDIPSLKIANAEVTMGGTDLSKSLIQFPGTADPGELGSPVIFGHSVLRQFYNPSEKNPKRYTSIFSTIMTMKKGDEIFVTYAGVKYKYLVQDKITVKPADTFILNQRYDSRQLKLVTCTPEGTYLNRGVVIAQLVAN
jgi:sortase A